SRKRMCPCTASQAACQGALFGRAERGDKYGKGASLGKIVNAADTRASHTFSARTFTARNRAQTLASQTSPSSRSARSISTPQGLVRRELGSDARADPGRRCDVLQLGRLFGRGPGPAYCHESGPMLDNDVRLVAERVIREGVHPPAL